MLTLGITLAAIGIVVLITGFILHATLVTGAISGKFRRGVSRFRMVIGMVLYVLGGLITAVGGIILLVLFIMWIVAQFA